jgi:hypothetical protein
VVTGPDRKTYLYPLAGGEPTVVPGVGVNDRVAGFASDTRFRLRLPAGRNADQCLSGRHDDRPAAALASADAGRPRRVSEMAPLPTPSGDSYVYAYGRTLSDLYLVEGLE